MLARTVLGDVAIYCLVCRASFRPSGDAGILLVAYFHRVAEVDFACRCSSSKNRGRSRGQHGAHRRLWRLVSTHPWWWEGDLCVRGEIFLRPVFWGLRLDGSVRRGPFIPTARSCRFQAWAARQFRALSLVPSPRLHLQWVQFL